MLIFGTTRIRANLTKFSFVVYNAIGLMSGSSLDGLDIVCAEFNEQGGNWTYEIKFSDCYPYNEEWKERLSAATSLSAKDYLLLHTDYGHYLGKEVRRFMEAHSLEYRVALVSSHGHTSFHLPSQRMTGQLGDGAAIAAEVRLPVVTDLRALDLALGGQGAPIVPIGEKWLLPGYDYYLNLGGIANVSRPGEEYIAFDICPANRVLNLLAADRGKEFDEDGRMAAAGKLNASVLEELNQQAYYSLPFPKSLANDFGTERIYPMVKRSGSIENALRTMVEHIAVQLKRALSAVKKESGVGKMLVTGGGALNGFLIERIREHLKEMQIEAEVPSPQLINYKEALIMAFIGILRWRQEVNVLSSVTGAQADSVGGALWIG